MSDKLWFDLSAAVTNAVFGVATAPLAVAVVALAVSHMFGSPLVRRTVWQVAIAATLGFCALELSGIGQASFAALDATIQGHAKAPTDAVLHSIGNSPQRRGDLPAAFSRPRNATLSPRENWIAREKPSDDGSYAEFSASRPAAMGAAEPLPQVGSAVAAPTIASGGDSSRPHENDVTTRAVASLGAVWFAGVVLLLFRKILACRGMGALVRRLPEYADADAATASGVRELAVLFRYCRAVRLVGLPPGTSPLAFGVVRPTIALPADFSRRFTAEERRAMLAHELAHLAAGDPLWRTLADLLVAALWWHPATWFVRRRLIEASELVADEASRAVPAGAEHLASALVALGKRLARRRAVAAYGAEGDFRSSLGRRVERLLSECERPWRPVSNRKLAVARAVSATAAVAVLLSVCYAQRSHHSSTSGEPEMKTFAATWRQSLCGVALAMFAGGSAVADAPAELSAGATTVAVVQQDDADDDEERENRREGERDRPREGERERAERERRDGDREGGERAEARRREAREIEARIERIRNRLRELGDRNPDESRELGQQAERLANRLRGRIRASAGTLESQLGQQAERLANRLRELRGEGERREGDRPDLERPDRERGEGDRPRGDRPDREGDQPRRPRPEQVERARHLRAAIEHLRAAGMPDLAERLAREHEDLMRSLRDRSEGDRPGTGFRDPPPRERPGRTGRPDRPDRPDGPPRDGDRRGPDRPDGPPREGDRPRPDRPVGPDRPDRPDGDRRRDAERREEAQREEAQREVAELRRALAAQHEAGDALRLKLEAVAKALAERTERAQAEEAARQAALKELEAARAADQTKLAELAERRASELALVQAELQAQMAKLRSEVENLHDKLAAKEAELIKTRELIEQRAK